MAAYRKELACSESREEVFGETAQACHRSTVRSEAEALHNEDQPVEAEASHGVAKVAGPGTAGGKLVDKKRADCQKPALHLDRVGAGRLRGSAEGGEESCRGSG